MESSESLSLDAAHSLAKTATQSKYPPRAGGSMSTVVTRVFKEDNPTKGRELLIYTDMDSWCGFSEIMLNYLEHKKLDYIQKRGLSLHHVYGSVSKEMASMGLHGTPAVFLDGEFLGQGNAMQSLERYFPTHNPLTPPSDHPLYKEFTALLRRWQTMEKEHQVSGYSENKGRDHFFAWLNGWEDIFARHTDGPWLLGSTFTWLDAVHGVPWKHCCWNVSYNHNYHIRREDKYENLNRYLDALDAMPEYQRMRFSDIMYKNVTPFRYFPTAFEKGGDEYRAMIQGIPNGESYMWPLAEERTAWGTEPGGENAEAAIQAGQELLENMDKVAKFALRSVKNDEDIPPVYETRPITSVSVDLVREVFVLAAHILLRGGIGACETSIRDHVARWGQTPEMKDTVWADLRHVMLSLCRKIGTPRDMSYPAVRQLRATLLWVVDSATPHAREDS